MMNLHGALYRLVVLPGVILLSWLLVLVEVLPPEVAVSVNLVVILCILAPASKWRRPGRHRRD
jgi:hypothetical protein